MKRLPPELYSEFQKEVRQIQMILECCVQEIEATRMEDPKAFEEYGQVVDRIYGTAATLGLNEFAEYSKLLKTIAYKCSQTDNEMAKKKAAQMMAEFPKFMELASRCQELTKEEEYVFNVQLTREKLKAQKLNQKELFGIERGSCD